jgi:hypothetical protein
MRIESIGGIQYETSIENMSLDEKSEKSGGMMETTHSSSEKVETAAVAENLTAISQPPSPWGKGHKSLYLFCALIYLCSTMNGMPKSYNLTHSPMN